MKKEDKGFGGAMLLSTVASLVIVLLAQVQFEAVAWDNLQSPAFYKQTT